MSRPEPINAVLYAQFHLRGGLKNTLWAVGIAIVVVGGLSAVSLSLNPDRVPQTASQGVNVILALQWLLLTVYGTSRVIAAVRQDLTSGLIESHRLTPTPPLSAAIGYVGGPPMQAVALAVVNFLVGLSLCVVARTPVAFWLAGNGLALAAAFMLWTLVALVGFTAARAAALPLIGFSVVFTSGFYAVVPALAVLFCPVSGQSLWNYGRATALPPAYAFTLVAQAMIAGVLLLAVARRYRTADATAFSVRLGVLLLLIWAAVTVIGQAQPDLFVRHAYRTNDPDAATRVVAGVVSSVLIAMGAISAAAWPAGGAFNDRSPDGVAWRAAPLAAVAGLCAALCCAPAAYEWTSRWPLLGLREAGTFAVTLGLLLPVGLLLAWQRLADKPAWLVAGVYAVLPSVLPLMLNAILVSIGPRQRPQETEVMGFGPVGALLLLWGDRPTLAVPGLCAQAVLVLLPLTLYASRRRRLGAAALAPAPASADR